MQKKANLTINPALGKDEKPAQASPTGSVDSGIGVATPADPGRTMTIPETPRVPTEAQGIRDGTPEFPISVIVNGYPIDATKITAMARELAQARANGEFPATTTPGYIVQATLDDHARLLHLRQVRGDAPREEWARMRDATEALVSIARDIRQRDSLRGEEVETNNLHAHVANMLQACHGETNLYQLVQHAVHRAIQNQAVQQDLSTGGVNMSAILQDIHDRIAGMADREVYNVDESNMEQVLEQVFGMIEHALMDTSAPLRMNVNRMDTINDAGQAQVNRMDTINDAGQAQVITLGTNINSLSGIVNSVAGNVQTMGTQVNLLQTIVNMIPQMVARAVQEILPQALHEAVAPTLAPIIIARLQERMGGIKGDSSATDSGFTEKSSSTKKSGGKKQKKPGFFKRFFGGPKRGGFNAAAGGACGACH